MEVTKPGQQFNMDFFKDPFGGQINNFGQQPNNMNPPNFNFENFFKGHQETNLLTGSQAGTIGLSEFHTVFPEMEMISECEGKPMLDMSMKRIGQFAKRSHASLRQAAKSISGMAVQHDVCERMMPSQCTHQHHIIPDCHSASNIYRTIDGSCNNLRHAKMGAAMTRYNRFLKPIYDDGVNSMRGSKGGLPRPREVTSRLQSVGPSKQAHSPDATLLLMQWGQLITHDFAFTAKSKPKGGCCVNHQLKKRSPTEDCQAVNVKGDPVFKKVGRTCFFFVRSLIGGKECTLGPREQMNQVTHYLDGSVVYGSTRKASMELRLKKTGKLRMTNIRNNLPLLPEKANTFLAGDSRVVITPALVSYQTILARLHNDITTTLHKINKHWNDEKLYQESRRIVSALIQHITYKEYLPLVIGNGNMKKYGLNVLKSGYSNKYNDKIDATLVNVFVTAAFRFGHTMVSESFKLTGKNSMSLLKSFSQAKSVKNKGSRPSDFLDGMAKSRASWRDAFFTPTLHNSFAATPKSPVGFDLYAISIQRGRDHGIPPYNSWRKACGLKSFSSFDDLQRAKVMPSKVVKAFKQLYRKVDDIDLFPAGLAEFNIRNSILGQTFSCIVAQQFHNLKHGDRFWYENNLKVTPFTNKQLQAIRRVGMSSIICQHTTISSLQPRPFIFPSNGNRLTPCSKHAKLDLSPWRENPSAPQNPITGGSNTFPNNPFGNEQNPFGNGQNPFGNGQNPFGNGETPFGNGQNPFGNVQNPLGNGQNPFGKGQNPLGNGQNPFGNGQKPFGNGQNPFPNGNFNVGSQNPLGTGQNPFGTRQNPFGNGQKPFGNEQFKIPQNPFGNGQKPFGNGQFNIPQNPFGNGQKPFW